MKILKKITLFLIMPMAVVALASSYGNPVGECPPGNSGETILLPDASDCSVFYKCSNGVPVRQQCPSGLLFNPQLQVCDYPSNVDCTSSGGGGDGNNGCTVKLNGKIVFQCEGNQSGCKGSYKKYGQKVEIECTGKKIIGD